MTFEKRGGGIWFPAEGRSAPARPEAGLGGKAANLARLESLGFPVPPWYAVTTAAFERALGDLGARIASRLKDQTDLASASSEIRAWILALDLPPGLEEEIVAAHAARIGGDAYVAVRSSAAGE